LRSFLQQTYIKQKDTAPGFFCTIAWEEVQAACCSWGISLNLWFRYRTVYWLEEI